MFRDCEILFLRNRYNSSSGIFRIFWTIPVLSLLLSILNISDFSIDFCPRFHYVHCLPCLCGLYFTITLYGLHMLKSLYRRIIFIREGRQWIDWLGSDERNNSVQVIFLTFFHVFVAQREHFECIFGFLDEIKIYDQTRWIYSAVSFWEFCHKLWRNQLTSLRQWIRVYFCHSIALFISSRGYWCFEV